MKLSKKYIEECDKYIEQHEFLYKYFTEREDNFFNGYSYHPAYFDYGRKYVGTKIEDDTLEIYISVIDNDLYCTIQVKPVIDNNKEIYFHFSSQFELPELYEEFKTIMDVFLQKGV